LPRKLRESEQRAATPKLACAVLSLGGDARLVGAVRSLLDQSVPVEIVVVNSGGGDPARLLAAAQLEVPLFDHRGRLYPGGVRNLAIEATRAPYVAFLAADCRAAPGWAAGRLAAHRARAAAVASVMAVEESAGRCEYASLLLAYGRRLASTPPRWRVHYSLSYDRRLFERYGTFREDLRAGEDTEFNQRFAPHEKVVWAPQVRTLHVFPDTPERLLRDQFRRGQLRARAARERGRAAPARIALQSLTSLWRRLMTATRASDRVQRRRLVGAWPLLLPGALAYAAGALDWRRVSIGGDPSAEDAGAASPSISRASAGEASGRPASRA
jgi:hypothetical protein